MSPRKQPISLYQLCIKTSLSLINDSCYAIEKMYPEVEFKECKKQKIYDLKCFLMATLPARYVTTKVFVYAALFIFRY